MKTLRIIFISLGTLIILFLLGVFIFLKTFDVNRYLPQITQKIAQSIDRKVSIAHGDLKFDWGKGVILELNQVSVGDVGLSSHNFMTTQKADISIGSFISGKFTLTDIGIELNILKTVLDKLSFIPGLSGMVQGSLSSQVSQRLNSDTTKLDKAWGKFILKDQNIILEDVYVESSLFEAELSGLVGFDSTIQLDVKIHLAADLSADLVKSVAPLEGLLDEQKRLLIPGKVSGKGAKIGFQPQIDYITKKILNSQSAGQIGKQLEKVLEKNPKIKKIVSDVLDNILGQ